MLTPNGIIHLQNPVCITGEPPSLGSSKFLSVSSSGHSHPSSWSTDPSLPQPSLPSPLLSEAVSAYPAPMNLVSPHFGKRPREAPASQMVSWNSWNHELPMNFILLEFKNHIHIRFFLYFPRLVAQCQPTSTWKIGTCEVGGNKIYIHLNFLIRKND